MTNEAPEKIYLQACGDCKDNDCENCKFEDLEEEIKRFFNSSDYHFGNTYLVDIARHFADWQKEQMMKGLCFETKVYLEDDGCAEDYNYTEWLALENTEITEFPEKELGLKPGDTVKVIIVKEDNK